MDRLGRGWGLALRVRPRRWVPGAGTWEVVDELRETEELEFIRRLEKNRMRAVQRKTLNRFKYNAGNQSV